MSQTARLLNALDAAGVLVHLDYHKNDSAAAYCKAAELAVRSARGQRAGVPKETFSMMSDLVVFALAHLKEKYKNEAIIFAIAFEMLDTSLRDPKSMYIIGQGQQTSGNNLADSLYILCSMSRVPSTNKCHKLYYHPPGYLGHKLATSPEVRRQALTSAAAVAPLAPAAPAPGAVPARYTV